MPGPLGSPNECAWRVCARRHCDEVIPAVGKEVCGIAGFWIAQEIAEDPWRGVLVSTFGVRHGCEDKNM